jgi:motility quorum-sensing regulator / GCU-specific mRNA interferase toxin
MILYVDKRKPTYSLSQVKQLVEAENYSLIEKATITATKLGYSKTQVGDLVLSLSSMNFYKSTNEFRSHRIWQDVYKVNDRNLYVYIKLKVDSEPRVWVMSFKQDEDAPLP